MWMVGFLLTSESSLSDCVENDNRDTVMYRISSVMFVFMAALTSCCHNGKTITVTNKTDIDRSMETVEVSLDRLGDMPKSEFVVLDDTGTQIPSQIIDDSLLLFQVNVKANSSREYECRPGKRMLTDTLAYSRYVPERLDDYAYENNLVAGRIYGKSLSDPRTFGPDIWVKSTDKLVIDKWFAQADYHHDHGEGLDCYKVGNTLGGGACAPVVGDKIIAGNNWATHRTICNGAIRTAAEFCTEPFTVNDMTVNAKRTLTLDANTRMTKWTVTFYAETDSLDVVLGAVLHDVVSREDGDNYISFTEKASDSQTPDIDGNISIGLVLGQGISSISDTLDGHAVLRFKVRCGEPVTYWTASGWSKGGVESADSWNHYMREQAMIVNSPLTII